MQKCDLAVLALRLICFNCVMKQIVSQMRGGYSAAITLKKYLENTVMNISVISRCIAS